MAGELYAEGPGTGRNINNIVGNLLSLPRRPLFPGMRYDRLVNQNQLLMEAKEKCNKNMYKQK